VAANLLAEFPYIQMHNDAASTASECEGGQSLVVLDHAA
jgi:hypothetical protein